MKYEQIFMTLFDKSIPKSKHLSFEERKKIQELCEKQFSARQISQLLNRSHFVICFEIRRNGGREEYNAEEANKKSHQRWDHRNKKLRKDLSDQQKAIVAEGIAKGWSISKIRVLTGTSYLRLRAYTDTLISNSSDALDTKPETNDHISLTARISMLEEQIKILTEQLKEILCQKF